MNNMNFDKNQLNEQISSARLRNVPLVIHSSVISLLAQEHGHSNINQTTLFCAIFFNNENDGKNAFILAMKKIMNKQFFFPVEVSASMIQLSIIKSHLLWLDEHPTAKVIDLRYINGKEQSQKILIDQQREIYDRLKNSILLYVEDKQFTVRLQELSREMYNIPKRIIIFLFHIYMKSKGEHRSEMLIQNFSFCRYLRGVNWYEDGIMNISEEDYILIVKRLLSISISNEYHQALFNKIGEEIFGKINNPQNLQVIENIKRIYKVPTGIMTLITEIMQEIGSIQDLMRFATFCGFFKEDQPNYDDKAILSVSSSATGKETKIGLKPLITKVLWKLCLMNISNEYHRELHYNLVRKIIGFVEINVDNKDLLVSRLGKIYNSRQKVITPTLNILKKRQNLPDLIKLSLFCSYISYQYEEDEDISSAEMNVIQHLTKMMLPLDSVYSVTVKNEEDELKKIVKEKYCVPHSLINLIFKVNKGKELFQKTVLCSYFKGENFVENRVYAAIENLFDENIPELTQSEKNILIYITKIMENNKTNLKQDTIYKAIMNSINKKSVENSSCPLM